MAWKPLEFAQTPWKAVLPAGSTFRLEKISNEGDRAVSIANYDLRDWLKSVAVEPTENMKPLVTRQCGNYPYRINAEKTPFQINGNDRPTPLDVAIATYRGEIRVADVRHFGGYYSDSGRADWIECQIEEVA